MKSPIRWLWRGAVVIVFAVIAGSFFRFEYTLDKSVRVDRLTGKQEVFCESSKTWTSVAQCYPTSVIHSDTQAAPPPSQP